MNWILLLASYLIGAIPISYLVARAARGIDLREHGSGNLGATNAFRVLGWKAAAPIVAGDIFKGWLPTALFPLLAASSAPGWQLAYGAAAVVGHVYSIYVGFRGGKGVATGTGVFLALAPVAVLITLVMWIAITVGTGYVSLASIVAALVLPLCVAALEGSGATLGLALALGAFVIYAHRANIRRLIRGEEHRLRRTEQVG